MNHPNYFRNHVRRANRAFFFLILLSFSITRIQAQPIQPRLNQGALLEPQGKIINGAGQDLAAYKNYWNVMHTQNKPLMYMTYLSLREATSDWADGLKADLMSHTGKFQIPQIGLSMANDGIPSSHYEQDVASGLYDKQISMFIDGLQKLAIPAYVRIGYEFNGVSWNGYGTTTYKNAFIHITNMIRARGVEVATVWDLSIDGVTNYMDYYPGDEYVDWWGINIFSAGHFTDPNAKNFMDDAGTHKKPVLIGETTARYVGVLNGQQSWNQWFTAFFTFIHTYPELKAFSYINWDWSQCGGNLATWGDARLEKNTIVSGNFANEMDSIQYLHASSESAFRKTFGLADNIAPAIPGTISVFQSGFPLQLNWNTVTDPSGLSHYIIYKNGVLSDYALTLPYSDNNVTAGEVNTYAVTAMDRAGNESLKTSELKVTVPSTLTKSLNGEFDNGTQNWQLSSYVTGAAATMKIDSSSTISGRKSCAIAISKATGTNWHIELWQWLSIHQGHKYKISFKAKASANKVIAFSIQQAASPNTSYLYKEHTLTTAVQTFTDSVMINTDDQAKIEFLLGASTESVWIDAISVIESSTASPTGIIENQSKPDVNALLHNYPNPFSNLTTITYRILEQGLVSLKVFDTMGKEVANLVNEQKPAGDYSIEWNVTGFGSGIYFCKLQTGKFTVTKKLVLQK
jgi:hypothetical protein